MNLTYENLYESEPSVSLLIRSVETGRELVIDAAVDTGSNISVLEAWIAAALDVDTDSSERTAVTGIGRVVPDMRLIEVEIEVFQRPDLKVRVVAALLPPDAPPIGNLLGTDALQGLDLGLSHANRLLYFGLPD